MRTRNQSKRQEAEQSEKPTSPSASHHEKASLTAISREAVGNLLKRATSRKASGKKGKEIGGSHGGLKDRTEEILKDNGKQRVKEELHRDFGVKECTTTNAEGSTSIIGEAAKGSVHCDANELEWEDGTISIPDFRDNDSHNLGGHFTVEFTESPSSTQRKPIRRASAEEKELAELVHKVHLLCLLARGRLIDSACNDPLIQASLLSLLPSNLLKIAEATNLKATELVSLVNWFRNNFHIRSQSIDRDSLKSSLAFALETHEGTAEEVAALSVALFRALNLTTRFVSIMDVGSLKPDADMYGCPNQDAPRLDTRIFSSSTNVASPDQVHAPYPVQSPLNDTNSNEDMGHKISQKGNFHKDNNSTCKKSLLKGLAVTGLSDERIVDPSPSKACSDSLHSCTTKRAEGSKRKGDVEFEMHLEMALSATAVGVRGSSSGIKMDEVQCSSSDLTPPFKKLRKSKQEESPVLIRGSSSAVWSRKVGPPLYWAEVYCSGETLTGRWVHVDAANAIVDCEEKVEAAAAACRKPLKYVVAFAGNGAKDVTRRYCMHWYKIASQRVSSHWWDTVLAPLKGLESGATGGMVHMEVFRENASSVGEKEAPEVPTPLKMDSSQESPDRVNLADGFGKEAYKQLGKTLNQEPPARDPGLACRNSLEDMELETRALTEPLPTNQLAYKSHHLYAIERWLTKYQILHPKGPVLGFCSGHPVYPRACVKTLQTKQKWLREGLQVKENEVPAKVVKHSKRFAKVQISEPSISEQDDSEATLELYGKWQMEPLDLPRAVNGIVPKNERGQVDVWSEKCLPPGTVHLRLPRLVPVARRLEIDFAPAMVGFDFHNGRSVPVFEGIVVCTEFKDAILEAYAEEEDRREAEEKKRNETQALSRWFHLLSSIVTRQRLKNSYEDTSSSQITHNPPNDRNNDQFVTQKNRCEDVLSRGSPQGCVQDARSVYQAAHDHEHVFPIENQSFDEESSVRTKRCPCGFSIQMEEL